MGHSSQSRKDSTRDAVFDRTITTFRFAFVVLGRDVVKAKRVKKKNHTPEIIHTPDTYEYVVIRMKRLRLGLDVQVLDAEDGRAHHALSIVAVVFDTSLGTVPYSVFLGPVNGPRQVFCQSPQFRRAEFHWRVEQRHSEGTHESVRGCDCLPPVKGYD